MRREERSKSRKVRKLDEKNCTTRICNERGWRDESRHSTREEHGWERWKRNELGWVLLAARKAGEVTGRPERSYET